MAGTKCHKCGLVNWAETGCCKRCGSLPPPPDFRPNRTYRMSPCEVPSLYTFNGVGTRVMGWNHRGDGTATATIWFAILFLPIFPLKRFKLLSPRPEDFDPASSTVQVLLMVFLRVWRVTGSYNFIERLPLDGREVFFTYLRAYVLIPLMLLAPMLLLRASMQLFHYPSAPGESPDSLVWMSVLWMVYVVFVLSRLLRRSRGLGAARARRVSATSSS